MKQMCKYALVQFMPFVETGEFANVGVIVFAPKTNYWEFKLAPQRFKRVTNFFEEMDREVYKVAINKFKEEMKITQHLAYTRQIKGAVEFFTEITRPRQALVRFSNVRTMITEDPEIELEKLYERYIHRDFVTEQYRENQMVTALKKQINAENIPVKYAEMKMKVGVREFAIPLAGNTEKGLKLIKPLAFDQKRPTQLFEHGETWINRLKALLEEGEVTHQNILLPIDASKNIKGERKEALEEVKKLFEKANIAAVNYEQKEKIIEFATNVMH
jgi:hypothetical protein